MSHLNDYLIPCKNEELAKAWTDGDPLGGGLPEVTSDDNGDVLTVVNGAWSKAQPSGGDGGLVIDVSTLDVPTYNEVEIYSLYVSLEGDEIFDIFGDGSVYVGDAPENAVIVTKTGEDGETDNFFITSKYSFSVEGLATSEGESYCITNDVTIWCFSTAQESIYVIPATAVIAPYNYIE